MNVAALVTGLKAVNSEVLQAQKNIASLQTGAKSLTDAQAKAAKSVEQLTKGYTSLKAGLGDVTKAFTSFEGIVGLFGGTIGTKAIGVTIEYNKTLLELSQQARMSGRSFAEMRNAIILTSEKTSLSEVEAAKFYQTLNEGLKTLTVSGRMVRELATDLSTAFGPALEDVNRGAQTLINIQSKIPDIFNDIRSSMPNNQYKEYILNLVQLGKMSAQEADAVLRTRKARQEGTGALTKEQQELRKLQEIKQEFQKGLQQFMLAVGKPLAEIMKSLGTAVKPLFEYINNFLKREEVQSFLKLLMKGGAIVLTGKMAMQVIGGGMDIFGGMKNLLGGGGKNVNIASIGGAPAGPIVAAMTGGKGVGAVAPLLGKLSGVLGSIAGRIGIGAAGFMAGSYVKSLAQGQEKGSAANKLGTVAGSGMQGASLGYTVGGPIGAQIGAVAASAYEFGNILDDLGDAQEDVAKSSRHTFTAFEKLNMAGSEVYGMFSGLSRTERFNKVAKENSEKENEARRVANIPEQEKRIGELFGKMGKGEREAFGIDTGASEEKQKKQHYEIVKESHLEKGGKEGEFAMTQTAKAVNAEMVKKALAEDELKINAAQFALREQNIALQQSEIAYQNTLLDIGNRYGQSVGSAQGQIDESVKALGKQAEEQKAILSMTAENVRKKEDELNKAKETEKAAVDGKKPAIEINRLTTNRIAAETQLKQLKQDEKDAGSKLRSLEGQRLDQIYRIRDAVGSIVNANKELIEYEAMYGKGVAKVNELNRSSREELTKQLDVYQKRAASLDQELAALIAQDKPQKEIDDKSAEIKLNHAETAKTQVQINQLYKNALLPLENRRNIIDAEISMEEANLELNKAINGGLGATLEIRSRIFEQSKAGVEKQDEIIAKLQEELALVKSKGKENLALETQLRQETSKRTAYIQKQVELTKSMRDGYLDALQSFQQVEGTFSKIIMTRESGLGEAMRKGMAAQGFTAGALGAGGQGPVMKRNPDGSVTMPTNQMLQNVWKQYEGKYDPNRPQVMGVESSAAGALKEQGLTNQFTGGQFGPQSSMYGNVRPTEGSGSQNIVLDKKFTKNIVNPSPEEVGRSLKVGADAAAGSSKTSEAKKAVEDSVKNPMIEATFPIVDELKKINETLTKGLGHQQAGGGAPGAVGIPGAKSSSGGMLDLEVLFGKIKGAVLGAAEQTAKAAEKVKTQVKDGVKEGQKEAQKETPKEGSGWFKSLAEKIPSIEKTKFDHAGEYRKEQVRDAEERDKVWRVSNKETNMSSMAKTMNTSGVGGKGIQYNEKQILKVAEAEKKREKALSDSDKKNEENTRNITRRAGKTVSEVQKETGVSETKERKKTEATEAPKITARQMFNAEAKAKSKEEYRQAERDLQTKYAPIEAKSSTKEERRIKEQEGLAQAEKQIAIQEKIAQNTGATADAVASQKTSERTDLNIAGYASGGVVPGQGTGDRIPAMLEPREFVVNKRAAQKYAGFLHMINAKGYADGGSVGYAALAGGGSAGGGPKININVRGDSAKKIMDEVGQSLSGVLNDMMTSHGGSGRYYDLPKSG